MRMNWDGIASIVEDGIVTKKGMVLAPTFTVLLISHIGDKLRFDVIVPSTGFAAVSMTTCDVSAILTKCSLCDDRLNTRCLSEDSTVCLSRSTSTHTVARLRFGGR